MAIASNQHVRESVNIDGFVLLDPDVKIPTADYLWIWGVYGLSLGRNCSV